MRKAQRINKQEDDGLIELRLCVYTQDKINKKHLKSVGPIHHCEPPHANSIDVASGTVARRLRIDVYDNADDDDDDDNDNA